MSRFFDGAPLIRVPGRMHPVEVRYVPTAADNDIQEVRFGELREEYQRPYAMLDVVVVATAAVNPCNRY